VQRFNDLILLDLGDIVGEAGIAAGLDLARIAVAGQSDIGSSAQIPPDRTARANASPSMSGISMSDTIASNIRPVSRSRSASAALAAAETLKPAARSDGTSRLRKKALSSTTRTS
jgi:hypothetical protein